jgi:superfamily II DNA or RNA helicase
MISSKKRTRQKPGGAVNGSVIAPACPPLTGKEQVQRQQLNILAYWSEKTAQAAPDAEGAAVAEPPSHGRWSLTGKLGLRDWQKECADKWFAGGKRGVVKVVTGAGKTVLALAIMERLRNTEAPDLRVAIVVPTMVLQEQWYELLTDLGGLPPSEVGRLGGGYQEDFTEGRNVLVCVLNSAAQKLPKMAADLPGPLLLVVDECHRAGAAQMSQVFQTKRAYNLGLSATPERDAEFAEADDEDAPAELETFDESVLGRELGPIIFELDYRQAIDAGILARFEIEHFGLPLEPEERGEYDKVSREITELRRTLQSQPSMRGLDGGMLVGYARKVAARGGSGLAAQAAQYVYLTSRRKRLVYEAKARVEAVCRLAADALRDTPYARILVFHESIAEVMVLFRILRDRGFAAVAEHSELSETLRRESLHLFRSGAANILVSARSLIEGFDVPAADVGIVAASSSSVRQRIQTLGRILRKKTGEQRAATLKVLFMTETTDEMIYEKQDWAAITGAERNRYFAWDPTTEESKPLEKVGPPRSPKPRESEVDFAALSKGDDYPGAYEGIELSSDTQGNVKDTEGRICTNPQGLPAIVHELRGSYGKFRVTPEKQGILVATGERGQVLFGGTVPEPLQFAAGTEKGGKAGGIELLVRDKAGGYRIGKKIKGGEVFALLPGKASDGSKGEAAARLALKIREAEDKEKRQIRRFRLLENGDAIVTLDGRAIVIDRITEGLEFPEIP